MKQTRRALRAPLEGQALRPGKAGSAMPLACVTSRGGRIEQKVES